MKPFDWVLLVISCLWFFLNCSILIFALMSKAVKSVEISWKFFIPILIWLFIAHRVGG